jgi:hypothetical protein
MSFTDISVSIVTIGRLPDRESYIRDNFLAIDRVVNFIYSLIYILNAFSFSGLTTAKIDLILRPENSKLKVL